MATIVFDFDSTLVSCESLELILQEKLQNRPDAMEKIHEITLAGLNGEISFSESLSERLKIAAPSRNEVESFGYKALEMITIGMPHLIGSLMSEGMDIWVVSGGLYESLLPVCNFLGIKESHILAVKLLWGNQGEFQGINLNDALSQSKVEGVASVSSLWKKPGVIVGDAMSDYRLYEQKILEHFILYTEHLECREILSLGVESAKDVKELKDKIHVLVG